MLGIKTTREPIGGDIADNIRSAISRLSSGQLNEQEKSSVERSKKVLDQYEVRWIGLDGKETFD